MTEMDISSRALASRQAKAGSLLRRRTRNSEMTLVSSRSVNCRLGTQAAAPTALAVELR